MITLGKLTKIDDLRSVWPNEAHDFTKWLSENLDLLGNEIQTDLELIETESNVGNFNVDIYAKETETGRKVIIENQLEATNHDHLGKLITYASGKDASLIIWIVKSARDEHKQAIEWLNQHTDREIGFFLIEIVLYRIGNSDLAPKFNIVEGPNDWSKIIKDSPSSKVSQSDMLRYTFWSEFNEYASNSEKYKKNFTNRKAQPQSWIDLSLGSGDYHITLSIRTQKKVIQAGVYFEDKEKSFPTFFEHKDDIEKDLGCKLTWNEGQKARNIFITNKFDIDNHDDWTEAFEWFIDQSIRFKRITKKYLK